MTKRTDSIKRDTKKNDQLTDQQLDKVAGGINLHMRDLIVSSVKAPKPLDSQ